MKKILYYGLAVCLIMGVFTACNDNKDQLTDSRLTYYAVMDVQGSSFVEVPIGSAYHDAGCKATLNGEDYTSHIVTKGVNTINNQKAGLYYVTYTATNADGFSTSATRTVAVCDPTITTDMSGSYTVSTGTFRLRAGVTTAYQGYKISVTKAAPGIFYVSDIIGGYYDQRAGYGESYAMKGYFQLMADNSIQILSGDIASWGDGYTSFRDGKYDPVANTISYTVVYGGMDFTVVMKLK